MTPLLATAIASTLLGPPPAKPSALAIAPERREVFVHVDSPRAVALERHDGDAPWVAMCEAPCHVEVPRAGEYRVVGDGVATSDTFRIDAASSDRVFVDVDPGSRAARSTGAVVYSVGATAMAAGFFMTLGGLFASASPSVTGRGVLAAGVVILPLGAAGALAGGAVYLANSRTRVSVEARRSAESPE